MYPRTQYEMTEQDLEELLEACKPVPMIALQCGSPSSPQENANNAWKALGSKMGFDHMTVEPVSGKGYRFFTAVPNENEEAKKERKAKEAEAKLKARIEALTKEISERKAELSNILGVENDAL